MCKFVRIGGILIGPVFVDNENEKKAEWNKLKQEEILLSPSERELRVAFSLT